MNLVKIIFFTVVCVFLLQLNSAFALENNMPVLRLGDTGEAVYIVQLELKKRGFYQYDVDGNFGSYTRQAIIEFQRANGLDDDGIVGLRTWRVLRNLVDTGEVSRGNFDRKLGQRLVNFAQGFLGVPYVWGGAAPGGFDCSGFVYYIYNQYGIALPRVADEQYNFGQRVPLSDIQAGDLVFFSTYIPGPSHVGIYVGNGQFIHASSGANEVTLTAMTKDYYQRRFLGAFRVIR